LEQKLEKIGRGRERFGVGEVTGKKVYRRGDN
jgi:hypothetical protein